MFIILGHIGGELSGWFNFSFANGFHLVVFFMISGYTIKKRALNLDLVNKKFSRLMVPYFVTCAVMILIDMINYYFIWDERSIQQITNVFFKGLTKAFFASGWITNFGDIDVGVRVGAIWFFPALFFAILIFQYLVGMISDNRILGVISALISLIAFVSARFIWFPFSIQAGMFAVVFLWGGYSLKKYNILAKIKWYHYLIAAVIFLGGIYMNYCGISFSTANLKHLLISPIVGISASLLVYLVAKITSKSKLLDWISRNSIQILCIHLLSLEHLYPYYNKVLKIIGLEGLAREWVRIILEIICVLFAAFLLEQIRGKVYQPWKVNLLQKSMLQETSSRNVAVDVARGFLLLSMMIGHFDIAQGLRNTIYSCHMMAFVFLSGYCYRKKDHFLKILGHLAKTFLVPYLVCFAFNILIDFKRWSGPYFEEIVQRYVLGMSFSEKLLKNVNSVGPVCFILMLFIIRIIYILIDKFLKRENIKWVIIIACTGMGIWLGRKGIWLPWSFDVALYSMLFYHVGAVFRKHNVLDMVSENLWLYFFLSPLWVYMIYRGGMEIAIRDYHGFGTAVVGALSGILLIYAMSAYISKEAFFLTVFTRKLGEASMILLVVHTLIRGVLHGQLGKILNPNGFAFLLVSICVQILVAALAYRIKVAVKNKWRIRRKVA